MDSLHRLSPMLGSGTDFLHRVSPGLCMGVDSPPPPPPPSLPPRPWARWAWMQGARRGPLDRGEAASILKGRVTCKKIQNSYLDFIGSVGLVDFFKFLAVVLWVKNAVLNGLLPLSLFVFQFRSIWDGLHMMSSKVRLQSLRTLCTVRGFPMVASYVAWRADQVLYGSCTLNIDSADVGSWIFVQDRALGGEARAKGYGRPN